MKIIYDDDKAWQDEIIKRMMRELEIPMNLKMKNKKNNKKKK